MVATLPPSADPKRTRCSIDSLSGTPDALRISRSSVPAGGGARHVGGADAFEREPVARALVDDAPQPLRKRDAGVAAGERRQRGDVVGDLVRTRAQAIGGHDLVDDAPILGG